MFAVPGLLLAVNVALYVPSPLSVTDPSSASVVPSVTVAPPVGTLLSLLSFARTVITEVPEVPSALIDAGVAVIVVCAASAEPGETTTLLELISVRAGALVKAMLKVSALL